MGDIINISKMLKSPKLDNKPGCMDCKYYKSSYTAILASCKHGSDYARVYREWICHGNFYQKRKGLFKRIVEHLW